jgi:NADPH:quinone reductase-like Zn-dependent oxidoreductase
MKAVVLTRTGGPEMFEVLERPDPAVGAGEVRIAVRAAGLNFADTMARVGLYPAAPKPPCVLGYEVAGEVEALGEGVSGLTVGQRVMAGTQFGGQAELAVAQARDVMPMPEHLSFEEGAAFCVNYGTAYAALMIMGGLREGNRVLIHAAAGGVGIAATQVARIVGAEIFGTASAAKHDAIKAQGVDHPIDYRNQDFKAEIRRMTNGEGVDVILDPMGPTSFRKDYRILRPGGRLIMCGLSEAMNENGRDMRATLRSLMRMPTSTMPWWNAGRGVKAAWIGSLHLFSVISTVNSWYRWSRGLFPSSRPVTRTAT